jgi:hypothetical protein
MIKVTRAAGPGKAAILAASGHVAGRRVYIR